MRSWLRLLPRLAFRNILRQARRSTLTAAAMVVGVGLLMMSRTLADGAHEQWIDAGVRLGTGHIAIQAPGYLDGRKLEDRLSPEAVAAARAAVAAPAVAEQVVIYAPRLAVSGLASSAATARPVQIVGVDPEREAAFSDFDDRVVDGRYLRSDDRLSAYVGVRLAEALDLEIGSRLVLTAQDADGEITGQLARIVGLFRTGMPEVDGGLVQIPLSTARSWLGVGDGATTVAVLLESSREVRQTRRRLDAIVQAEAAGRSIAVRTWQETMPELEAGLKIDDFGDYVFHTILLALVALAIVNTVLMSVLYRTREFGVLQSLGLTPSATAVLVFTEGLMLTALSGVIGVALGLFVTWFFWRDGLDLSFLWDQDITVSGVVVDPVLVPEFGLWHVVIGLGVILAIGMLASIYPAYRATRIQVAEAMKFER